MQTYQVTCPHCGVLLQVAEQNLGMAVQCPGCSKPVTVQAPAGDSNPRPDDIPDTLLQRYTVKPKERSAAFHYIPWLVGIGAAIIGAVVWVAGCRFISLNALAVPTVRTAT